MHSVNLTSDFNLQFSLVVALEREMTIVLCRHISFTENSLCLDSIKRFNVVCIPVKSTDFGGSLPIFLPSYRQPTDLPQSTDFYRFFRGSTEF